MFQPQLLPRSGSSPNKFHPRAAAVQERERKSKLVAMDRLLDKLKPNHRCGSPLFANNAELPIECGAASRLLDEAEHFHASASPPPHPPTITACFPSRGPVFVFSALPVRASIMMKLFCKINSATARHLVITINWKALDPFAMVSIQGGWKSFRVGGVLDSILRFDYFNCSASVSKGHVITSYWCYSRF